MSKTIIVLHTDADGLSRCREEIRAYLTAENAPGEIEVVLADGIYRPEDFVFEAGDCSPHTHITYRSEHAGGVILRGGVQIGREHWMTPDADMAGRFSADALPNIRMLSLAALGLGRDDWGEEIPIGAYHTAHKYDNAPTGCGSEFFTGGKRMTKARYPNAGTFAKLSAVADVGDVREFPEQNYFFDWDNRRNHRGGTYIIDRETNRRVASWKDSSTAWMFGYFYHDWADSSTPVTFNTENRLVFPAYVSRFAAKAGANYYFYNIPEELDTEGEWYLDRETGNVYFWPYAGAETAEFTFRDIPLLDCRDTCNMTFSGFVLEGTMGDAVVCTGCDMTFDALCIRNIAGTAVRIMGSRNTVCRCDISRTGKGGIYVTGGDRRSLTPGENRVTENYIHDYAEIYLTYQGGISLQGVGNIADHNEICRAPHTAIFYGGNEHLIEYNDIYDVVMLSSDAGAIYSGFDWAGNGTVIRYNRLRNIGGEGFVPDGIYWDDGLSGQTAYGNIFINVKKHSMMVGGGRDCVVENNIIIDAGISAIQYDDRNRDGFVHDGWARAAVNTPDAPHWQHLAAVPFRDEPWKTKYPHLAAIKTSFETDPDDPDFPINPAYSSVKNNVIISPRGKRYQIAESVYTYSDIGENPVYDTRADAGWDEDVGNLSPVSPVYRDLPEFTIIPVKKIGRSK
ncbi:MAG: right-handed parallel beta-helix repeat-containing protein [Clostridia bacterium]|nr:right-handed parallel beta-helix repeat-containing protein [Clostridia bacterium]